MEGEDVWETLVADNDYEINTEYPHNIRKKSTGKIVSEWMSDGYYRLCLNGQKYFKHKLIAEQFILNPDNLPQVDHINHIRTDNRIENLRYVTSQQNNKNRCKANGINYNYVDEIGENSIEVKTYGKHEFDDLYYDPEQDLFYFFNGIRYRELHVMENNKCGTLYVNAWTVKGKLTKISYSAFKRQYNLI
ncbi:HNH endonuclease family [Trichomonas vaginalis G3]|uniref:HNH endonuclease family n=1 Tax=Trichomonas vaginalis (strain ATCC PRA-98 / G3) TaxID=412133 RepID=UPI0021E565F0|nr:HNH endonuclease family [Trichomonas vaginalis G3]XP_051106016.1 HNH endonuclease family [Trichomonas vaginalis G3]XP_051106032.1 HNH endonuclease family [Trichomonas vaginalis G3]KAI5541384.1 HNH endonuclease family [Trichomonas vaginalis G3]KAI5541386.1 HNH endonuclease family [Trichomonas vaginalis G3]KAI5541404.1 HNH endonuclease family [Trichomonas vaginalis G3]